MNILAIDTVTDVCSVAVHYQGETVQRISQERVGHSNLILGLVSDICGDLGISLLQLDMMAVDIGPGSFTGVRIGIGVVQGLAYGADLPVMGVNSLEVLASSVQARCVMPALDARMGQIYCGLYDTIEDGLAPQEKSSPIVCDPDQIPMAVDHCEIVGLGSGWDQYRDTLEQQVSGSQHENRVVDDQKTINWLEGRYPEAKFATTIALKRGLEKSVNPLNLQAFYVRNQVASVKKPK